VGVRCVLLLPALLAGCLVAMAPPASAGDGAMSPETDSTVALANDGRRTLVTDPLPPVPFVVPEWVGVSMSRELAPSVRAAALAAAADVGASATVLETVTVGLAALTRGDQIVQAPTDGWWFPLTTTIIDPDDAAVLMGQDVADVLAGGQVVFGSVSAGLRDARADDIAYLRGADGVARPVPIGAVVDHDRVRSSEVVMSIDLARRLGFARPTRVVMWGYPSRDAMDSALRAHQLPAWRVMVSHSTDAPSPDSTLSTARTKAALGEFAITAARGRIVMDPAWFAANIQRVRFRIGSRTVVTWCHRLVAPAVQAAFDEIAAARLSWKLDVTNIQRYGGCYNAREVTAIGSTTGGQLSRHAWGMAFDLNTRQNCMGCRPRLDCRIVRIFRAHGFAWGGNFLTPDGMHFEWVGEARNLVPSPPGELCPNIVPASTG